MSLLNVLGLDAAEDNDVDVDISNSGPRNGAQSDPVQNINAATRLPSRRTLTSSSYQSAHRRYGTATIERAAKTADDTQILFKLKLAPLRGQPTIEYQHRMSVLDADNIHPGSSLGYSDIDFPREMSGKGIGYIYHYAAALAAQELGIEFLAVDTVTTPAMEKLCEGLGMTAAIGGYGGRPDDIVAVAGEKVAQKGWTPEITQT
jgi:hypothetical protein